MMTVISLHIKPVKKGKTESVKEMELIADFGPVGDAYGGPGDRQITLLGEDDIEALEEDREKGLCIKRFTANIILTGSAASLNENEIYRIGEAAIRITGVKKRCFPECAIVTDEKRICLLPGRARFASIEQGGSVKKGDILKPYP